MKSLETLKNLPATSDKDNAEAKIDALSTRCANAMGDDFNTPILISVLFDAVKLINKVQDGQLAISKTQKDTLQSLINGYVFDVLGLEVEGGAKSEESNETGPLLDLLVNLRSEAKSNQDWSTADAIRNALSELGVTIKDGKEGSTWDRD